jgi:MFS family permease
MPNHRNVPPEFIVIAAGVGAAMHIGKLPPALPILADTLGLDLLASSFLLSMIMLAGLSLGLLIGTTADAIGLRRALLSGLFILSLSSFVGGWTQTPSQLLMARAAEGLGFLLIVLPAPGLIRQLVTTDLLSRRLGWWTTYMGIGIGSTLLLGPPWISVLGWRSWWWLIAAITGGLFALALLRLPKVNSLQTNTTGWLNRIQMTLTNPGPWLVALTFSVYAAQWMAIVGFLPTLYTQAGYASWQLGGLTASVALINIAGNVLAGQMIHRGVSPFSVIAIGFCIMLVCTWMAFAMLQPGLGQIAWILLFSGLGGVIPGSLFYVAVQFAPAPNTMASTVGWIQQWISMGQFSGPPLLALAVSWYGRWDVSWWVTGGLSLLGLGMTFLMWRHQQRRFKLSTESTAGSQ